MNSALQRARRRIEGRLAPVSQQATLRALGDAGVGALWRDGGEVYHTSSSYARGADVLWGMYQWLDRAPLGRDESGPWLERHDEYDETP